MPVAAKGDGQAHRAPCDQFVNDVGYKYALSSCSTMGLRSWYRQEYNLEFREPTPLPTLTHPKLWEA